MDIRGAYRIGLVFILLLALAPTGQAEPKTELVGGDYYRSGSGSGELLNASRDVFASGASVTVRGKALGDAHVAGFDIDVEIDADNVYAAGASVGIWSEIAKDLTAAGASVKTGARSRTAGNARLAGGTVTVNGAVDGALMVMGGEVIIDAPIAGDVRLTGGRIEFGSAAKIGGTLTYSAPAEISIPETVISADRVTYRPLALRDVFEDHEDWGMGELPLFPTFVSVIAGFIVTLAFIVLVAALFLSFAPGMVEARRLAAVSRPGLNLVVGVLGLSVLIGLIPVAGMLIIGIPLIPIVILAIILVWTLGYILGALVFGLRLRSGFGGEEPGLAGKLIVLAVTVTALALVNFVPFIGWLLNFAVVLFGVGAITTGGLERFLASQGLARPQKAVGGDYQ